jgi:hypothetical protein
MISTLFSLENNLLQYNIKQNLLSEKTAKILEIAKALVHFHEFQYKIPFDSLRKSQFGISLSTKNFENNIRQDLELLSNSQQIVIRERQIREKIEEIFEQMKLDKDNLPNKDFWKNNIELQQYADFSVKNLNYLQSNLRLLVENEIKCINDFIGESQRSLRGLNLIRKCLFDLENGNPTYHINIEDQFFSKEKTVSLGKEEEMSKLKSIINNQVRVTRPIYRKGHLSPVWGRTKRK